MNQAFLWFVLWSLGGAGLAHAAPPSEDAQACVAASTRGQTDRDEGRLLAARDQLLSCAREGCPSIVKKSCAGWLTELGERIPSVVVRVHEAGQRDITDAHVLLDGRAVALDGRPVPLDPGMHTLSIEAQGGPPIERTFLVAERERGRLFIVEVPARSVAPANSASAPDASRSEESDPGKRAEPHASTTAAEPSSAGHEQSSPPARAHVHVPGGAWVLGGLGVAGVVTFAALLAKAKHDLDELEHTCSPDCPESESDAGYRKLLAADVSLGIGLAALAGAGAWTLGSWFVHRRDVPPPSRAAELSLVPTRGGAFASLAARY